MRHPLENLAVLAALGGVRLRRQAARHKPPPTPFDELRKQSAALRQKRRKEAREAQSLRDKERNKI